MALGKSDGKVVIDTSLDNEGFIKGVKGLRSQLGGLQSVVRKLGTVIASVFAVRSIVNFSKECIELGSNVAEVQNVVDVAFGDMTDKVEAFASTAIQNFGMSRLAAKKTASTYMAMAKGMGVAEETAADMSITLAGLTGDVASFYNISQELADTKLKSVFTGETESLKDLGVVMTQTNLEAYALSKGISKNIDDMTQAEKVALRYNFVLDQLALANGDFARTSDSWANQTRILSMQWEEFMSIIGQALITVLTPCVKVLNQIVANLINIAAAINSVVASIFGTQQAVSGAISESVAEQDAMTDATKETAKAQKGLLAGFDEINKLSSSSDTSESATTLPVASTESVVPALGVDTSAAEKTLGFIQSIRDAFGEFSSQIDWNGIQTSAEGLWSTLSRYDEIAFEGLRMLWEDVLQPLGLWAINTAAPVFLDGLNEALDLLADTADVLLGEKSLSELVDELTPLQTALLGLVVSLGVLVAVQGVSATFTAITTFLQTVKSLKAASLIGKLAEVLMLTASGAGTLGEAMSLVFGPGSIIAGIAAIVGGAILAVTNFLSMLDGGFSWVNEGLMLLGIAIAAVGAVILGAPATVAAVVAAIIAAVATAVVLIKEHWAEIKDAAGKCWEWIKETWGKAASWFDEKIIKPVSNGFIGFVNGLIGMVESFVNFFVRGINKIISAANSLSFDVPDWVPGIGGATWGFNIPKISEVKLPRLATGAVIPPNREFLAVLGDQTSGTNIEAPLSTIEQAVENVLRRRGSFGDGEMTLVLDGDLAALVRVLRPYMLKEDRRVGVNLVTK